MSGPAALSQSNQRPSEVGNGFCLPLSRNFQDTLAEVLVVKTGIVLRVWASTNTRGLARITPTVWHQLGGDKAETGRSELLRQ